ncbi:MAG: cytochrome c biogenesis protein CcsA [Alphaproteobacteria bacterium]|nr:cytochrome c biogenesis protein CcsA [Alphaproteobacteria bacterium]
MTGLIHNLAALLSLLPITIAVWRGRAARDGLFWALTAVALAGPLGLVAVRYGTTWNSGLSEVLWVTVLVGIVLFALLSAAAAEAWRLAGLLFPYLILLGLVATIWDHAPAADARAETPSGWILVHILLSVVTYALLTLAAIAGLAVLLRERGMRLKRRHMLSDVLPSIADSERLQVRLLVASEGILGVDVLNGMGIQFLETGQLLVFDHKTLFMLGAFVLIGVLLFAHYKAGLRGRRAARWFLVAYLLVTLGYPGVKFVQDILLS